MRTLLPNEHTAPGILFNVKLSTRFWEGNTCYVCWAPLWYIGIKAKGVCFSNVSLKDFLNFLSINEKVLFLGFPSIHNLTVATSLCAAMTLFYCHIS